MKIQVYNMKTCFSARGPRNFTNVVSPKITISRSGKFTLNKSLIEILNSDYIEVISMEDGKLYLAPSTPEDGFKLRADGKTRSMAWNSVGLYKVFNETLRSTPQKRVKSATLEVITLSGDKILEINNTKPLYFVEEFDPNSTK